MLDEPLKNTWVIVVQLQMFGEGVTFKLILDSIAEADSKSCSLGTHHYVQMSTSEELKNYDPKKLSNLEMLFPAGAAVPEACEKLYLEKFPSLKHIMNGYGQSEIGLITVSNTPKMLGYVLPGNTICVRPLSWIMTMFQHLQPFGYPQIKDPNNGDVLGPNQHGEICAKNSILMKGYLNRKQENDAFLDDEGFAHTGDIGYHDEEGLLHFVDRIKALMK